jgi:hypothetical protein
LSLNHAWWLYYDKISQKNLELKKSDQIRFISNRPKVPTAKGPDPFAFDSWENIFQVKKASKHENPSRFRKICLSHAFSDIIALKKFTSTGASENFNFYIQHDKIFSMLKVQMVRTQTTI